MDVHAVTHICTEGRPQAPSDSHPVGRMLIMVGSIMSVLWPCASSPMRICDVNLQHCKPGCHIQCATAHEHQRSSGLYQKRHLMLELVPNFSQLISTDQQLLPILQATRSF